MRATVGDSTFAEPAPAPVSLNTNLGETDNRFSMRFAMAHKSSKHAKHV
jgi:hypothetical protein